MAHDWLNNDKYRPRPQLWVINSIVWTREKWAAHFYRPERYTITKSLSLRETFHVSQVKVTYRYDGLSLPLKFDKFVKRSLESEISCMINTLTYPIHRCSRSSVSCVLVSSEILESDLGHRPPFVRSEWVRVRERDKCFVWLLLKFLSHFHSYHPQKWRTGCRPTSCFVPRPEPHREM